jgi:hypothetical protein
VVCLRIEYEICYHNNYKNASSYIFIHFNLHSSIFFRLLVFLCKLITTVKSNSDITNMRGNIHTWPRKSIFRKVVHLKEKLVISVPFVIQNFLTLLKALYNHNFAKLLQIFKAIYTCIQSVTLLYNKNND